MRAGERSGAKFLTVCWTPLSKSEMSFVVIGVEAPLARTATTLSIVDASLEGWARRPACANNAPSKAAAVRTKTKARQPARAFLISGSAARLLVFVLINLALAQVLS